jgi:hypothetical protein
MKRPARETVLFDLKRDFPELASFFASQWPEVQRQAKTFKKTVPVFPLDLTEKGRRCRLPGHFRSFFQTVPRSGVIAFKGTEPALGDIQPSLEYLSRRRVAGPSPLKLTEHYLLQERKIPMAALSSELIVEARRAAEIQASHLRIFGKLAEIPVPLFVHRLPSKLEKPHLEKISKYISRKAIRRARTLLDEGLAYYVYWYPAVPLRANGERKAIKKILRSPAAMEDIFQRWLNLFLRLLALDYVPCTRRNRKLGACLDAGNAVVGSGFCDVGSVTNLRKLPSSQRSDAVFVSFLTLRATMIGLLMNAGSSGPAAARKADRFLDGKFKHE